VTDLLSRRGLSVGRILYSLVTQHFIIIGRPLKKADKQEQTGNKSLTLAD